MLQTLSRVYVTKALDCLTSNWFLNTLATQHKNDCFLLLRCCGILGLRQAELVANKSIHANKSGRDVSDHFRTLGFSAKNFAMQLASAGTSRTYVAVFILMTLFGLAVLCVQKVFVFKRLFNFCALFICARNRADRHLDAFTSINSTVLFVTSSELAIIDTVCPGIKNRF